MKTLSALSLLLVSARGNVRLPVPLTAHLLAVLVAHTAGAPEAVRSVYERHHDDTESSQQAGQARQDILSDVNAGLVVLSFLAAMAGSLVVPIMTRSMARLVTGTAELPEVELSSDIPLAEEAQSEGEEEEEMATTKVRRSTSNKYLEIK